MDSAPPVSAARMLEEELALLRPDRPASAAVPASGDEVGAALRAAHEERLSALCLSGGGVRSAAFATGLIEGLARRGRLATFDYLSTVSGGGYAGAWLSAWRHHARRTAGRPEAVAPPQPWPESTQRPGESAEPEPLLRLRRYARYLAPHTGVFSIDLWAVLATMGRNLLLIWLVLLPVLAALLLVPYIYYAGIRLLDRPLASGTRLGLAEPDTWFLAASVALIGAAVVYIGRNLPSLGGRGGTQRQFLLWCLVPLCLGALGLTVFWAFDEAPIRAVPTMVAAATLSALTWLVAGLATGRRWRPKTWIAAAISGAFAGAGIWFLTTGTFGGGHDLRFGYATFAFPLILGLGLAATVLHVGLSRDETSADDLEWWGRFGAWVLVIAIAWLAISGVVFWGPAAIDSLATGLLGLAEAPGARISGILGVLTTATGGAVALSGRAIHGDPEGRRMAPRLVAAAAVPSFVVLLLTLLALLNLKALRSISAGVLALDHSIASLMGQVHLMEAVVLTVACGAFGLLMAVLLPVNKFSLHGMYRNRLVRTFVGAARPEADRSPSPFTDFDRGDDVPLADLAVLGRPLHVVNITLNMVADTRLADQQRKSEAFTLSPLHAGAWKLGYRPSRDYAADRLHDGGITLGTAITLSGAAASPNMGARSSPLLTFLLTLMNARLGAWLGNPGLAGSAAWRAAEPRVGPWLLLRELFGSTTDESPYVFLSDGGHFENLGLYEMVRRRCHLIVVSDAGCDPDYAFGDLSNAIRLIRIDFSIPIEFPDGVPIGPRDAGATAHFAVGRIRYSAVDGPDAPDGILVYAKATLTGDEPWDVLNYARSAPAFPHESTAHQFFSEAQFESYRVLGRHTVDQLFAGDGVSPDMFRTATVSDVRVSPVEVG
jgi:hypothetical protein